MLTSGFCHHRILREAKYHVFHARAHRLRTVKYCTVRATPFDVDTVLEDVRQALASGKQLVDCPVRCNGTIKSKEARS